MESREKRELLERWNYGIMESWKVGRRENSWNYGIMNYGIMESSEKLVTGEFSEVWNCER